MSSRARPTSTLSITILALATSFCAPGPVDREKLEEMAGQTLAQIDFAQKEYEVGVYTLPKKLDEEVARLHLEHVGVKLTTMSKEQADYIGVPVDGPYKPDFYRY